MELASVRFLGDLVLNLWDCGGQESFMENYFTAQRDHIFLGVEVLIYVFDVESNELERDMMYFQNCVDALKNNSSEAKVFCLVHKMDLIIHDVRERVFQDRVLHIRARSAHFNVVFFKTSIWDETLYQAWSSIVHSLVPNVKMLESSLKKFSSAIESDEVILFEKTTFLVISHVSRFSFPDVHRFEKISNIVKQFKLRCSKSHAQIKTMEFRGNVSIYIDTLTSNTYVMLVFCNSNIRTFFLT